MSIGPLPGFAVRHPWMVVLTGLFVTVGLGAGLFKLQINTDGSLLYPKGSNILRQTYLDRQVFNQSSDIILLLSSQKETGAVFTSTGLHLLKDVHEGLGQQVVVDATRLRSLANQIDVPDAERIEFRYFLDPVPTSEPELEKFGRLVKEFPLVNGLYLSGDGRHAALYAPLAEGVERSHAISELKKWMSSVEVEGYKIRLLGVAVAEATLGTMVLRDLATLIPVVVGVVLVLLIAFLSTAAGLLIVLTEVVLVLVWVFGLMGHLGIPVTIVTTILPVVLVVVAITDEIHLIERIEGAIADHPGQCNRDALKRVVTSSVQSISTPLVLTSITTAIGFLTFLTADIEPLQHFGVFSAFGILVAMLLTFTFIPSLLTVIPLGWFNELKLSGKPVFLDTLADRLFKFSRPGSLLLGVIILLGSMGLAQISVQDAWVKNFSKRSDLYQAEGIFNRHFWGSYSCDVVLAAKSRIFYRQEGMQLVQQIESRLSDHEYVGGSISYLTALDRVSSIMGEGDRIGLLSETAFDRVYKMIRFVSPVVGLKQWINDQGTKIRIQLLVRNADHEKGKAVLQHIEQTLSEPTLDPYDISYHTSGGIPMATEMVDTIVHNQIRSFLLALGCVFILLIVVLKAKHAVAAILPVVITALIVFELIGLLQIDLGITTSMFATIAICIGVDFALFIIADYRTGMKAGFDAHKSIYRSVRKNARAIGMNTLILGMGFIVLAFSSIKANFQLGVLLALSFVLAYLASHLVLPFLLRGIDP